MRRVILLFRIIYQVKSLVLVSRYRIEKRGTCVRLAHHMSREDSREEEEEEQQEQIRKLTDWLNHLTLLNIQLESTVRRLETRLNRLEVNRIDLNPGDRIFIINWSIRREKIGTVTSVDQQNQRVNFVFDNTGRSTWRAPHNVRLLRDEEN